MIPGPASGVTAAVTPSHPNGRTILVAEDSPSFRLMLRQFLAGEGFNVLEAGDGDNAWDLVSLTPGLDLVVTDVDMPGSSGIDLLTKVREHCPNLPVILITGSPSIAAAVNCIRSGAFGYIPKPFALDAFKKQVDAALAAATSDLREARGFAGYRIIRTLGEGGSGIVFLVEKAAVGSGKPPQYALKILKGATKESPARDQLLERFVHEAEAVYRVRHPNVLEHIEHGLGREEKIPYLVMEYFPGVTLTTFTTQFPQLALPEKAAILRQAAAALGAIHAHGILHRDVKPTNLLVDPQSRQLKFSDFGVARLPESSLTEDCQLLGTPVYMAPEAFLRARCDWRADVFSLGVVAYEFLLGHSPWPKCRNLAAIVCAIQKHRPPAPCSIMPDFPPQLQDVLERALQKNPSDRLCTANDLATVFGDCAAGRLPAPAVGVLPVLERLFRERGPRVWA